MAPCPQNPTRDLNKTGTIVSAGSPTSSQPRNTFFNAAQAFLACDNSLLEDPLLLPDMRKAISRLQQALIKDETIGIFGDFDAYGITGTALLADRLENLGAHIVPYIPQYTSSRQRGPWTKLSSC